jgi:hypothetical protein
MLRGHAVSAMTTLFLSMRPLRLGHRTAAVGLLFALVAIALTGCSGKVDDFCCSRRGACEHHGAPTPVLCPDQFVCAESQATCVPATATCSSPADCGAGMQCVRGACGACASDADCSGATPFCDAAKLVCRGCESDLDCDPADASRRVCNFGTGECTSCRSDSDCSGDAPFCTPSGCRQCTDDKDCADGICTRDSGTCAGPAEVLYVATDGDDARPCSRAEPCRTIRRAVELVDETRRTIVVAPGSYTEPTITIDGKRVALIGPGASLGPEQRAGAALEVIGSAEVIVERLTLGLSDTDVIVCRNSDAATPRLSLVRVGVRDSSGAGIAATSCDLSVHGSSILYNFGGGIVAAGGTTTVTASYVVLNHKGGLSVTGGAFELINNVIARNGSPGGEGFGGVRLAQIASVARRFEFNTVADNRGDGDAVGVSCNEVGAAISLSSSIVYGNGSPGAKQVGGSELCTWTYSLIGPQEVPEAGTGNVVGDPLFAPPSPGGTSFDLELGSPAIDAADPAARVHLDIDGNGRSDGKPDMGADER